MEKMFCWEKAQLFTRRYVVLNAILYASKIWTEVLNVLKGSASPSVNLSQTMFDLVMYTLPREEVLKERKSKNFCK